MCCLGGDPSCPCGRGSKRQGPFEGYVDGRYDSPSRRESPYVSDASRNREREREIENTVGSYYCGDLGRWMKVGDSDYHRYYKPGMH